jgi:hypothetical protein
MIIAGLPLIGRREIALQPPNALFVVQRNTNANEVWYTADAEERVAATWHMADGTQEGLTRIEQPVYGVTQEDEYFTVNALPNLPLFLSSGRVQVLVDTEWLTLYVISIVYSLLSGVTELRIKAADAQGVVAELLFA